MLFTCKLGEIGRRAPEAALELGQKAADQAGRSWGQFPENFVGCVVYRVQAQDPIVGYEWVKVGVADLLLMESDWKTGQEPTAIGRAIGVVFRPKEMVPKLGMLQWQPETFDQPGQMYFETFELRLANDEIAEEITILVDSQGRINTQQRRVRVGEIARRHTERRPRKSQLATGTATRSTGGDCCRVQTRDASPVLGRQFGAFWGPKAAEN